MYEANPPQTKIDTELLPSLHRLIYEEYHYFAPYEAREQKKKFYDTGRIDFTYPEVQKMNLDIYQDDFNKSVNILEKCNIPEAAKILYQAKFSEHQHLINELRATAIRDDIAFHEASRALYGTPDPKLCWFNIKMIDSQFTSLIARVDAKRKTLHAAYAVWKEYFNTLTQPENVGVYHIPMFNGIYVPNDYEVDSAEKIHRMFKDYLEKNQVPNWTVQIDYPGARTSFSVNQQTKVISIPHDSDLALRKKVLTKISLEALLMHEVGVHVVRRENGDASDLALLGIGLDNYVSAEEGIATLAEQLITGTSNYAGETGYLAVGAAMGTLGNPLDFSSLYYMLNAYFTLSIANKQISSDGHYEVEELLMSATEYAWNRALRVYRGTTGNTRGAIYTRDIIYLNGNKRMWKLMDSDTTISPSWLIGKYDPANELHTINLKKLGIL